MASKKTTREDTLATQVKLNSIKQEIQGLIRSQLAPIAQRYGYREERLEHFVPPRPMVLILGNYSAGKSTFINYLVGTDVQRTGQAPTDDNFTVLTHLSDHPDGTVKERDGRALMAEEILPLRGLKEHGERLLSHLCLKQVKSDFLRNLVLVDTPGMLDSISENDRGYEYQEVIGELAGVADLILLIFDAHKAGTVRESYLSLRDTLPKATMEDRVLFVLNRVDECQSVDDLVRVHGALCWNLSQMTGRKDIPRIYLTYTSPHEFAEVPSRPAQAPGTPAPGSHDELLSQYLQTIASHKDEVIQRIMETPHKRLDHLATFAEIHSHGLRLCLSVLKMFQKHQRRRRFALLTSWTFLSTVVVMLFLATILWGPSSGSGWDFNRWGINPYLQGGVVAALIALVVYGIGRLAWRSVFLGQHQRSFLAQIRDYAPLKSQYDRDLWEKIEPKVHPMITSLSSNSVTRRQRNHDYSVLLKVEKQLVVIRKKTGGLRHRGRWSEIVRKRRTVQSSGTADSPESDRGSAENIVSLRPPSSRDTGASEAPPPSNSDKEKESIAHIIGEQVDLLNQLGEEPVPSSSTLDAGSHTTSHHHGGEESPEGLSSTDQKTVLIR